MGLRCKICNEDFPSVYWFPVDSICKDCYKNEQSNPKRKSQGEQSEEKPTAGLYSYDEWFPTVSAYNSCPFCNYLVKDGSDFCLDCGRFLYDEQKVGFFAINQLFNHIKKRENRAILLLIAFLSAFIIFLFFILAPLKNQLLLTPCKYLYEKLHLLFVFFREIHGVEIDVDDVIPLIIVFFITFWNGVFVRGLRNRGLIGLTGLFMGGIIGICIGLIAYITLYFLAVSIFYSIGYSIGISYWDWANRLAWFCGYGVTLIIIPKIAFKISYYGIKKKDNNFQSQTLIGNKQYRVLKNWNRLLNFKILPVEMLETLHILQDQFKFHLLNIDLKKWKSELLLILKKGVLLKDDKEELRKHIKNVSKILKRAPHETKELFSLYLPQTRDVSPTSINKIKAVYKVFRPDKSWEARGEDLSKLYSFLKNTNIEDLVDTEEEKWGKLQEDFEKISIEVMTHSKIYRWFPDVKRLTLCVAVIIVIVSLFYIKKTFDYGPLENKPITFVAFERDINNQKKWEIRLIERRNGLKKMKRYDADKNRSINDKINAWQKFSEKISENNPFNDEDEYMRPYASKRLTYWQNRNIKSRRYWITSNERFIDNGDGTVTDSKTGLMWAREDNGEDIQWRDARKYCNNLTLAGYLDWRIPTGNELKKLYDEKYSWQTECRPCKVHINPIFKVSCPWFWGAYNRGGEGHENFSYCTNVLEGRRYRRQGVNNRILPVRKPRNKN